MTRYLRALGILVCSILFLGGAALSAADKVVPAVPAAPAAPAAKAATPAATDLVAEASENGDAGYASAGECASDCCPTTISGCCPAWTVDGGVIFLSRNGARAQPSTRIRAPNQTEPSFDMASSAVGTAVGPDISLSRCLNSCWDIQARYFQIDGWNDTNNFGDFGRAFVLGYNTSLLALDPGVSYSSRLYNVELNLRWKQLECMPVLFGFRTLGLDESFQITSAGTPLVNTTTNNGLYGMQLGVEPVLWDQCNGFRLEGLVKAGLYGNSVHQRTTFYPNGQELNSSSHGVPSCVAELGLIGSYSLNKCWSIRAGYEVMWITSVALAPDQSSSVVFGTPVTGTLYDKATAFYYGGVVSVERKF